MVEGVVTTAGQAATTDDVVIAPARVQADVVERTVTELAKGREAAAQPAAVVYCTMPEPDVKPMVVAKLME